MRPKSETQKRPNGALILLVVCLFASVANSQTRSFGGLEMSDSWTRTQSSKNATPVRFADQISGANAGAKIAACITALPSTGGTCDARGLQGAQQVSSDPFTGVTKPVLLDLGAATITVSVDVTVPSNVTLRFNQGGLFSIANGRTLTIQGAIEAPVSQILGGSGTILISSTFIDRIYPQWFGGKGDGTNDDAPAIQKAIDSLGSQAGGSPLVPRSTLYFPAGVYLCHSTLTFKPFINYVGVRATTANAEGTFAVYGDTRGTVIRAHTDIYDDDNSSQGVLIYIETGDLRLSDLTLVGTSVINSNPSTGIQFGNSGTSRTHEVNAYSAQGLVIDRVNTVAFVKGWEIFNIGDTSVYNARWEANTTAIWWSNNPSNPSQNEVDFHGCNLFNAANGFFFESDSTAYHIIKWHGGQFDNIQPLTGSHVKYDATIAPRIDLAFYGTEFRQYAPTYKQFLIGGSYDTVARTIIINGCVRSSNVVTCTTSAPHGLHLNERVTIAGVTYGGATPFNGTVIVSTVPASATTFTYAQTGEGGTGSGGTATPAEFPVSINCYSCRIRGGVSQIYKTGTANPSNVGFYNCKFENSAVEMTFAQHTRFDGSSFDNSYVQMIQDSSYTSFNNTLWENYSGTAIQFDSAGSNYGTMVGASFASTVTTPYTADMNGALNTWIVEGNVGVESRPTANNIAAPRMRWLTNSGNSADRSWDVIANQNVDGQIEFRVSSSNTTLPSLTKGSLTKDGRFQAISLATSVTVAPFSAAPIFDASLGDTQKITLAGNVSSSTLSNAGAGQRINFIVCQDASGGHSFTWPANVKGGMTIGSAASKCSSQDFIFDGTNAYALSGGTINM